MIVVSHKVENTGYDAEIEARYENGKYKAIEIDHRQVKEIMEQVVYDLYLKEAGEPKSYCIVQVRNIVDDLDSRCNIEEVFRKEITKEVLRYINDD